MDDWGWHELEPWLDARIALPIGPLFCVTDAPADARGRPAELAPSFDAPPPEPAFVDASLPTSSGTHTR